MNTKALKAIRNMLAALAAASGIFLLGICGAGDQDQISFGQLCLYGAIGLTGLATGVLGSIVINNELEWRGRK